MKIKVSYFKKATDTCPKTISLDQWLRWTIDPPKKLLKLVNDYRNETNEEKKKKKKIQIPAVTISSILKKERNLNNIKKKNAAICIDIDRFSKNKKSPHNLCLDFELAKSLISSMSSCLYVGYSVSSDGINDQNGLYAIILLNKKTSLKKAFKYFQKEFSRIGINIDPSCKDYTRLRFFSYDPNACYKPNAKPFKVPKKKKFKGKVSSGSASDQSKVEEIVNIIEREQIDITSNYNDWIVIAGALYSSFGESGRDYFHRISKFYPKYSFKKTDRKYDSCSRMNKVSISSFFHIATEYGIRY